MIYVCCLCGWFEGVDAIPETFSNAIWYKPFGIKLSPCSNFSYECVKMEGG